MKLTANFSLEELECNDGTPVPTEYQQNALKICERAQALRTLVGPLRVNSGFRTDAYNAKIGGAKKSRHLTASALDLHSDTWSAEQLAALYEGLIRLGVVADGGLGVYPKSNFIHIDLGPARRWGE